MEIQHLRLASFRAHQKSRVRFGPKINLIHGPNGSGKTNILEAVHYLALSKSFLTSSDQYALRKGSAFFEVEAGFSGTRRKDVVVRLVFVPGEGKRLFVNKSPLDRLAQIVGTIPVVVFAPSDHALTAEGPEMRRRFLDNILSQARPAYLEDLLNYRRALRQRNAILLQYRKTRSIARDVLSSWNAELVRLGSQIVARRLHFMSIFQEHLAEAYRLISAVGETPGMEYQSIASFEEGVQVEEVAEIFERQLARVASRELESGRSLVGPHRDEIVFRINDLEVRRYASQGQHQTFGMALKLAQFFYLQTQLDETPILLLDDLFGNLDAKRSRVFLELLQTDKVGQSLITAAEDRPFRETIELGEASNRSIYVDAGQIS